jgi:hypothetical protein
MVRWSELNHTRLDEWNADADAARYHPRPLFEGLLTWLWDPPTYHSTA